MYEYCWVGDTPHLTITHPLPHNLGPITTTIHSLTVTITPPKKGHNPQGCHIPVEQVLTPYPQP